MTHLMAETVVNSIDISKISKTDGVVPPMDDEERDALFLLGSLFIQHNQIKNAITIFESLRTYDPSCIFAHKALAYLYVENGEYKSALLVLDILRTLTSYDDRTNAVAILLEARAYDGLGLKLEAKQRFKSYKEWIEKI